LVSLYLWNHFWIYTLGRALRILHWIAFINKRRYSNFCLHDSIHLLCSLQHIRTQHDLTIQRRRSMEGLSLRRTNLHHSKFCCKIHPIMASIYRNIRAILTKNQLSLLFYFIKSTIYWGIYVWKFMTQ
jgi:hypothetical protein